MFATEPVDLCVPPHDPIFWMVRPLRDRGMRLPRFVWAARESATPVGMLEVKRERIEQPHRQLRVAKLIGGNAKNLLPCIRDVYFVALKNGDLTLPGFEQGEVRYYAQTDTAGCWGGCGRGAASRKI